MIHELSTMQTSFCHFSPNWIWNHSDIEKILEFFFSCTEKMLKQVVWSSLCLQKVQRVVWNFRVLCSTEQWHSQFVVLNLFMAFYFFFCFCFFGVGCGHVVAGSYFSIKIWKDLQFQFKDLKKKFIQALF